MPRENSGSRKSATFPGILLFTILVLFSTSSLAQWPTDPSVDLEIAESGQWPLVAVAPDESAYCAWMVNGYEYSLAMQYLSPEGKKLWGAEGLTLENFVYGDQGNHLIATGSGHAVLVTSFTPAWAMRINAIKFAPDGSTPWGTEGVNITMQTHATGLLETAQGNILVSWNDEVGQPRVQLLTPEGGKLLPEEGRVLGEFTDYGHQLLPLSDGGFLAFFFASVYEPVDVQAMRFDQEAQPVWPDFQVVAQGPVSEGIQYRGAQEDGQDGAYFVWYQKGYTRVWWVSPQGDTTIPQGGLLVSEEPALGVGLARVEKSSDLLVYFYAADGWGPLAAQRLDQQGTRIWGPVGQTIFSAPPPYHYDLHCEGKLAVCLRMVNPTYQEDQVTAFRIDDQGQKQWYETVVQQVSNKRSLAVDFIPGRGAVAIWEDLRAPGPAVLAKRINIDGSLGYPVSPVVPDLPEKPGICVQPNPFNPVARVQVELTTSGDTRVEVFDLRGRCVATLVDSYREKGHLVLTWQPEGVASGVYHFRVTQAGASVTTRAVLLK